MSESTEKLEKKLRLVGFGSKIGINRKARQKNRIGGIRIKDRNQQKSQAKKVRIGGIRVKDRNQQKSQAKKLGLVGFGSKIGINRKARQKS